MAIPFAFLLMMEVLEIEEKEARRETRAHFNASHLKTYGALLFVLIIAFNWTHADLAHNFRQYSLIYTLVLANSWLFLRAIRTNLSRWWIYYGMCCVLGLWIHSYFFFSMVSHFFTMLHSQIEFVKTLYFGWFSFHLDLPPSLACIHPSLT
jgi:uncharacterized membrane protein